MLARLILSFRAAELRLPASIISTRRMSDCASMAPPVDLIRQNVDYVENCPAKIELLRSPGTRESAVIVAMLMQRIPTALSACPGHECRYSEIWLAILTQFAIVLSSDASTWAEMAANSGAENPLLAARSSARCKSLLTIRIMS